MSVDHHFWIVNGTYIDVVTKKECHATTNIAESITYEDDLYAEVKSYYHFNGYNETLNVTTDVWDHIKQFIKNEEAKKEIQDCLDLGYPVKYTFFD